MEREVKVSVIVPVYNAEEHLNQCLDTIVNQTLEEIEIICVDDGSTDRSLEILKQYAKKDSRIKVIQQENQYAGVARNNALKVAHGEYVIFLDSDDFFEKSLLEKTYNQGKKMEADIVLFGAKCFDNESGNYIEMSHYLQRKYIPGEVFSRRELKEKLYIITTSCPWTKIFRREFIIDNNIWFQNLKVSNDVYFVLVALATADRITYIDDDLVYYRIGQTKNLQKIKSKNPTTFFETYRAVYERLQKDGIFDEIQRAFANTVISGCIYNLDSVEGESARIKIYREVASTEFEKWGVLDYPLEYYPDRSKVIRLRGAKHIIEWYDKRTSHERKCKFRVISDRRKRDSLPVVSIIVPVYNVAPYLKDCLDSLKNQTLTNIEIICVNDGSTDNSFEILYEYAEHDERFVLCTQDNSGQSVARNEGIKRSKGKYLYFMDSDDVLDVNALEILSKKMQEEQLQILYFDGACFLDGEECREKYEASKEYYIRKYSYEGIYTGQQLMSEMVKNDEYRVSPCLQLIDRKYVAESNFKFMEGIIHEDNLFNYQCMLKAQRVGYINKQLFYRRYRPGSTMTCRVTFAHVYGYFRCYLEMQAFFEKISLDENCIESVLKIIYRMLLGARNRYYELPEEEQYSVFGLPQNEQMLFKAYISDIHQMRRQRDRFKSERENINRKLQKEIKERAKEKQQIKRMEDKVNKLQMRLKGLETSETFMIGKIIMWIPRKIRGILGR